MFGLQLYDFAAAGATLLYGEFMGYFARRKQKKKLELIGSKSTEVFLFDEGRSKSGEFFVYIFGGSLIAVGVIRGILNGNGLEMLRTVLFGLALIYLPGRTKESKKLVIGEHGLFNSAFALKWENISVIEWDKDINQTNWGVSIFKKGSVVAEKIYVNRKDKKEIQQKIDEYFSRYTENKYFGSERSINSN